MENKEIAKQVGERLRRIRQAKGLSQQQLADMMFTTPQNISKYEKNGISDIDTIRQLSDKIGQDLLVDEKDVEGPVGEVGKEILRLLIKQGGHGSVDFLIDHKMHGMSEARFSHEVFKLEKIGLCVREQYIDYDGRESDRLFITAKGLITYENLVRYSMGNSRELEAVEEATTYEEFIGHRANYQEVVDSRPFESIICGLNPERCNMFRYNYIRYLKNNFQESPYGVSEGPPDEDDFEKRIAPGKGFYFDLLYMMTLKLDKGFYHELSDSYEGYLMESYIENDLDELKMSKAYGEPIVRETKRAFDEMLPFVKQLSNEPDDPNDIPGIVESEDVQRLQEEYDHCRESVRRVDTVTENPVVIYLQQYSLHPESPYPTDWFSDDEIREFINSNLSLEGFCSYYGGKIHDVLYKECSELEQKLHEINKLNPDTLEYFRFPKTWEENGLAQLVRETYGIADLYEKLQSEKETF